MFSSKILNNISIYLGANIINAGIPFLLMPVLTRVLTPADYGIIAMFNVALSICAACIGLSVHGAVSVRFFQMKKQELAQFVGSCICILLTSTLLFVLLVSVLGDWLVEITGIPVMWLNGAVVLSCLQFVTAIQLSLLQVRAQAKYFGAFQVFQSVTNLSFSLLLILGVGMAWQGRLWGQVLSASICGLLSFIWLLKEGYLAFSVRCKPHVYDALRFGVPLIPHVVGATIVAISGRFIVTNMLGVTATGIYMVAMQFGMAFGLVADAFCKVYGPWLYGKLKDESDGSRRFVVGMSYIVFVGFFVASGIVAALIFYVFPFIVGSHFLSARHIIIWVVLGYGFTGMYYAVAGFFFFSSKTKYVSIITVTSGLISLVATPLLIMPFGLIGASAAFCLSQFVTFILAWFIASKIYPMPWADIRQSIKTVHAILTDGRMKIYLLRA